MTTTRRTFLVQASAFLLATPALAKSSTPVALRCLHTGRSCRFEFDGTMRSRDVQDFLRVTADWRAGLQGQMDLTLVSVLADITRRSGADAEFQLISGYRHPTTNAQLKGTAKKSKHMEGKALDIRNAAVSLSELRTIARAACPGGVGYYPQARNNFVHIDTAGYRSW